MFCWIWASVGACFIQKLHHDAAALGVNRSAELAGLQRKGDCSLGGHISQLGTWPLPSTRSLVNTVAPTSLAALSGGPLRAP